MQGFQGVIMIHDDLTLKICRLADLEAQAGKRKNSSVAAARGAPTIRMHTGRYNRRVRRGRGPQPELYHLHTTVSLAYRATVYIS